jgi:hypothetical protein
MIPGEVRSGFFQELVLHAEFPRLAFELSQALPFADVQRRFFAGVVAPVRGNPVTESTFADIDLTGNGGDRT